MKPIGIHMIRRRHGNSAQGLASGRGSGKIHSYAALQKQLHNDLLAQHPEWIDSDGNCPTCDEYDRRLAKVISIFQDASQQA